MSSKFDGNWTIMVFTCCKEKKVPIFVPDPQQWTLANIKEEVEEKIDIPASDQVIYCNEKVLPEQLPLVDCEGMRNGVALLVSRKPFIVNVYRSDADITVPVELPNIDDLTMAQFCEYICHKFGIRKPYGQSNSPATLIIEGQIIKGSNSRVLDEDIRNGCLIILSVLTTSKSDSGMHKCSPCSVSTQPSWTLHIEQIDGPNMDTDPRVTIDVPTNELTPVANLRQLIKNKLSIETYQQKLTVGGETMEDYDDDGRCLLLCNYPAVYNGATLYLVQLTGGMHVKHKRESRVPIDKVSKRNLGYTLNEKDIDLDVCINIINPRIFTAEQLAKIVGFEHDRKVYKYAHDPYCGLTYDSHYCFDAYSKSPIDSFSWIENGALIGPIE